MSSDSPNINQAQNDTGWINKRGTDPNSHFRRDSEKEYNPKIVNRWKDIAAKGVARFHAHKVFHDFDYSVPELKATRYSYDVDRDVWNQSEETVKVETQPFAKGSLRSCFRMKKTIQVAD
eukprot:TRINITY_DN1986_c0_g1_i5.p1 TRINITY_DN1986_c0_g1~~TRINITY_DN1986_c0_g1_i5.p1  ORF type:complete len:120 (-),score=10.56 TRINITY_DN1986_c0_g1_i5:228-587(-)